MVDLARAFSEVKSLPDNILNKELTSPSGMIPGWLALGEIHERKRMRAMQAGSTKRPSMVEEYTGMKQPMLAGTGVRPQQPQQLQQQGMMPSPQQMPQQGMPSQPGIAGLSPPPQGYASGGVVSLARGGRVSGIEEYIRRSALQHGIDPDIAVRVARSEGGLHDLVRQSDVYKDGIREESYGPFQLYIRGGLGNRALAAGIDPRNPEHGWKAIDFALAEAKNRGWGQWYGAAKAGISDWAGIGSRGGAEYPSGGEAIALNTSATTTDVATAAADTAEKMTTAENAAGGDAMAQYLLAQQLMPQQPQAPAVQPMQMSAPVPFDPHQFVQDPAFYFRNRERYG